MENGLVVLENNVALFKKLNIELPFDPAIIFLSRYIKEMKIQPSSKFVHKYL